MGNIYTFLSLHLSPTHPMFLNAIKLNVLKARYTFYQTFNVLLSDRYFQQGKGVQNADLYAPKTSTEGSEEEKII